MFKFNLPNPEEESQIVVENERQIVQECWFDKECDSWIHDPWASGMVVDGYSRDDPRFKDGTVRWMYKSEMSRSLDIFMKKQITEEIT